MRQQPAFDVDRVTLGHTHGATVRALDLAAAEKLLRAAFDDGIGACAIVLMHGYRYPVHEVRLAEIARSIGFRQVSVSHEVSPLMKLVSRGDTTVVDAYLSPILRRYVAQVEADLPGVTLQFMGNVVERYAPNVEPEAIAGDVEKLL